MVLYRLADASDMGHIRDSSLQPPRALSQFNRDSVASASGESLYSLSASDSKYPSGVPGFAPRGMIAYAYDPLEDSPGEDQDDLLHDAAYKGRENHFPWRGILNVGALLVLIAALMMLFIFYPVDNFVRNRERFSRIVDGNVRINGTGQAPVLFSIPSLVDKDTPDDAKTRTGYDGEEYELVFSDEFNEEGRTFYPGEDPFWEAVDIWYGVTGDLEWYDPSNVITTGGALKITMDDLGSMNPDVNHGLQYRSGMLQSWNKFCFSSGYVEIATTFPGPNQNTQGYWPGAWTMGNLGRPGYIATTDGMWPYTYDSCDVGTFPNQTRKDRSGPAAALFSDASRDRYHNELSWLPGQRLSSCSCPNSDHPGPWKDGRYTGRGAPEIDILEASRSKHEPTLLGQTVSQSAQFAPFTHDYNHDNVTEGAHTIQSPQRTIFNTYKGSAIQQSVSTLTQVPDDMFQGNPNKRFVSFGFEYWADPNDPTAGYVQWQVDGQPTHRMGANSVGPDPEELGGSGVGQRLVPVEPMSIILNLGISPNWQTIDTSTLLFPSEMLIDYVRVYQRKSAISEYSISCNPPDFPTTDYINAHQEAYMNPNKTIWEYEKPRNSLYDGC